MKEMTPVGDQESSPAADFSRSSSIPGGRRERRMWLIGGGVSAVVVAFIVVTWGDSTIPTQSALLVSGWCCIPAGSRQRDLGCYGQSRGEYPSRDRP
jgi:hypothetical protein